MGVKKNGNILLHIPYNAMPYASVLFFFNLTFSNRKKKYRKASTCLLYTSDAADDIGQV